MATAANVTALLVQAETYDGTAIAIATVAITTVLIVLIGGHARLCGGCCRRRLRRHDEDDGGGQSLQPDKLPLLARSLMIWNIPLVWAAIRGRFHTSDEDTGGGEEKDDKLLVSSTTSTTTAPAAAAAAVTTDNCGVSNAESGGEAAPTSETETATTTTTTTAEAVAKEADNVSSLTSSAGGRGSRGGGVALGSSVHDKMPNLPQDLESEGIMSELLEMWEQERKRPAPSLRRVLTRYLHGTVAVGTGWGVLNGILSTACRPLVLRAMIDEIVAGNISLERTFMLLGLLGLVVLLEGMSLVNSRHTLGETLGLRFVACNFNLIFCKIVKSPSVARVTAAVEQKEEEEEGEGGGGGEEEEGEGNARFNKPASDTLRHSQGDGGKKTSTSGGGGGGGGSGSGSGAGLGSGSGGGGGNEAKLSVDNLVGNDVMRRFWDFFIFGFLPLAVSSLICGIIVLLVVLGTAALSGIAVVLLLLLFNWRLGVISGGIEKENLRISDARVALLTEIVNSIKAVKFFAWEDAYFKKIKETRDVECKSIASFRLLQVLSVLSGRVSPVLAAAVSIITYGLQGNELSAGNVFSTIAIFQAMRMSVITLPMAIISGNTILTSISRLQDFLTRPDHPERVTLDSTAAASLPPPPPSSSSLSPPSSSLSPPLTLASTATTPEAGEEEEEGDEAKTEAEADDRVKDKGRGVGDGGGGGGSSSEGSSSRDTAVSKGVDEMGKQGPVVVALCDSATFNYDTLQEEEGRGSGVATDAAAAAGNNVLSNVCLSVNAGTLTAIVGPVGSGKTTLLLGLIGELTPSSGRTSCAASLGYVPQRPFVISGSVLENILFGRPFDAARVDAVLEASDFNVDLVLLQNGLATEVGERGTTLSGGQQQRLSIARALYGDPELLVLDDALSAVDAEVCGTIFRRAILGQRAAGRAVIMACNQLQLLSQFDTIMYLDEGRVAEQGTYAQLMATKGGLVRGLVDDFTYSSDKSGQEEGKEENMPSLPIVKLATTHDEEPLLPLVKKPESVAVPTENVGQIDTTTTTNAASIDKGTGDDVTGSVPTSAPAPTATTAATTTTATTTTTTPAAAAAAASGSGASGRGEGGAGSVEKTKKGGAVNFTVYVSFLQAMGYRLFFLCWFFFALSYTSLVGGDVTLLYWIQAEKERALVNNSTLSPEEQGVYISIYGGLAGGYMFFCLLGCSLFCYATYCASRSLHHHTIKRLLYAPYSWFQRNPIGRIISRYTNDLSVVDIHLAHQLDNMLQLGTNLLALTTLIMVLAPPVIPAILVSIFSYYFVVHTVDRANRGVKRDANALLAPVQSNVTEANAGRAIARALNCSSFFIQRHHRFANKFNRTNYASFSLLSWGQLVAVYASLVLGICTGIYVVAASDFEEAEAGGLALTYAFVIPYYMTMVSHIMTMLASNFTSLERILEYMHMPQEAAHHLKDEDEKMLIMSGGDDGGNGVNAAHFTTDPDWPRSGSITFEKACLTYGNPHAPDGDVNHHGQGSHVTTNVKKGATPALEVLHNISLHIESGWKVGVVGRTGAGKSSLINLIFRLVETSAGRVLVDGKDIGNVGLNQLRRNISIIPQNPILMAGTVRYNLDPFDTKSLGEILDVLELANLPRNIIDMEIDPKGGGNLSAGQRQMLCFARALLHPAPIVIMDEPTANCDMRTDDLIQGMVRDCFQDQTVITVAHRLNTIIDYDRVLVLDAGRVVEYGPPEELLDLAHGHLRHMASSFGHTTAVHLREKARSRNSSVRSNASVIRSNSGAFIRRQLAARASLKRNASTVVVDEEIKTVDNVREFGQQQIAADFGRRQKYEETESSDGCDGRVGGNPMLSLMLTSAAEGLELAAWETESKAWTSLL